MNKNAALVVIMVLVLAAGVLLAVSMNNTDSSGTSGNQTQTPTTSTSQIPVTSGENPQPGSVVHDQPVEPAAAAARKDLAARLGVGEKTIVILLVEEATWNNGCLGLGGPDEFCTMALVPGFKVELLAKGKTYVYRTNTTGTNVRLETK